MRRLQLREVPDEERAEVERLAHSRTAEAREVERARIIAAALHGGSVLAIAADLRLGDESVRRWIKRFNAEGLAGLKDRPRSGAPPTYSPQEVAEVVAAALTPPQELELPFASWTLDRLAAYLHEQKGIAIKRSRIDEILRAEGLRWRKHESWFGERVDPDFAEKRGRSRPSTPRRRRAAL
jgi:transposase